MTGSANCCRRLLTSLLATLPFESRNTVQVRERLRLPRKADTFRAMGGRMRPNRRQFLGASVATAATSSFWPAARAQDAGTMTFAASARSPNSLEPAFVVQGADNWVTMQIFDTLVRPEDGTFAVTPGDFKPSLAESWTS